MAMLRMKLNNALFPVSGARTIIGRSMQADVVVDIVQDISRQHCAVCLEEDGSYALEDFGSRNGTFVNEHQIQGTVELNNGDVLRVGKYIEFVFMASAPQATQPRRTPTHSDIADYLRDRGPSRGPSPTIATIATIDASDDSPAARQAMSDFASAARKSMKR